MATYYYDFVSGNNANAGTDSALPKKTFGVTVTLVAGDQHLFKRGATWSGALNEVRIGIVGNTGGSATNRTILGAYGEGEKPIIDGVWTSNTTYGSLVSAGTSGTPAAGEYSVPANNTLYINIGTNPSGTTVEASKNPPINTLIQDCVSYGTIDSDGAEGHGFGSDDFSINTTFSRCIAYGNEGYAFTFNKNNGSSLLNCLAYDNEKGVQIYSPSGTITASGNTIDVDPAQLGCLVLSGRANVTAKNNVLIGGTAGLYVGSATVDAYTESNNAYSGYATAPIRFGATTPDPTSAITADPLLTSNYAPTPSSPLLGAGTHLGYTRDINRKQRPNPPSIGAYDVATMRTPE